MCSKYRCLLCDIGLVSKAHANSHAIKIHNSLCPLCCKKYDVHNSYRLLRHLKKHVKVNDHRPTRIHETFKSDAPAPETSPRYSPISETEVTVLDRYSPNSEAEVLASDSNINTNIPACYSPISDIESTSQPRSPNNNILLSHVQTSNPTSLKGQNESDLLRNHSLTNTQAISKSVSMCTLTLPKEWISDSDSIDTTSDREVATANGDPHHTNKTTDELTSGAVIDLLTDSEGEEAANSRQELAEHTPTPTQYPPHQASGNRVAIDDQVAPHTLPECNLANVEICSSNAVSTAQGSAANNFDSLIHCRYCSAEIVSDGNNINRAYALHLRNVCTKRFPDGQPTSFSMSGATNSLPLAPRVALSGSNTQTVRPFINEPHNSIHQGNQSNPTSPCFTSSSPSSNASIQKDDSHNGCSAATVNSTVITDQDINIKYPSMVTISSVNDQTVVCRLCGVLVFKSKESLRSHFLSNHKQLLIEKLTERRKKLIMARQMRQRGVNSSFSPKINPSISPQSLQSLNPQYVNPQNVSSTQVMDMYNVNAQPSVLPSSLLHHQIMNPGGPVPVHPQLSQHSNTSQVPQYSTNPLHTQNVHLQQHTSSFDQSSMSNIFQQILLSCPNMHCSFKTGSTTELSEHITQYHQSGLQFCNQCDYSTLYEEDLKSHQAAHHRTHFCQYCPYTTHNKSVLAIHETETHASRSGNKYP